MKIKTLKISLANGLWSDDIKIYESSKWLLSADCETWRWEFADGGCVGAEGVAKMSFIDGAMNADLYKQILNEKITPSSKRIVKRGILQSDYDPKHTETHREKLWSILKQKAEQQKTLQQ